MLTLLIAFLMLLLDLYLWRAVRKFAERFSKRKQGKILAGYFYIGLGMIALFLAYRYFLGGLLPFFIKQGVAFLFITVYFVKLYWLIWLFLIDLLDGLTFLKNKIFSPAENITKNTNDKTEKISRNEFLLQAGLYSSVLPLGVGVYGITTGLYDYQIRKQNVFLPNLPKAFDGLRIVQISDIHSGSFFNKKAVLGGIEQALGLKADVIFFTGDLVNYDTTEVKEYFSVFNKLKADLGVFSVLGNHDYGDYRSWNSLEAKNKNLKVMIEAHQLLGWDLLIDTHRFLEINKEKIALLGVGNWGVRGSFPKYGDMQKTYQSLTEPVPVKLLLSHDPSHWDAKVRNYQDIDLTFSGHTHGMQVGFRFGEWQWSPVQYLYEQWSGLYQKGNQYIYVNQGFGYSDIMPVRVGMLPEITEITLKKSKS